MLYLHGDRGGGRRVEINEGRNRYFEKKEKRRKKNPPNYSNRERYRQNQKKGGGGGEKELKERERDILKNKNKKKEYIPSYSIPAQVGACHISSSCQYNEPSWRFGNPLPRR